MIKNKFLNIVIMVLIIGGVFLTSFTLGIKDVQAATATASCSGSSSVVSLSWPFMDDVSGYLIRRNGSIIVSRQSSTSYTDSGVVNSTSYSYVIEGLDNELIAPVDSASVATGNCLPPIDIDFVVNGTAVLIVQFLLAQE